MLRGALQLLAVFSACHLLGQSSAPSTYYYCIERLDNGATVRRGITPTGGIPQDELILAPETDYREWLYDATRGLLGVKEFRTPQNGFAFTIPPVKLGVALTPDTDGDGLSDDAEFVIGTSPVKEDSDVDGIKDGAEIAQGLDPLDGLNVRTGVLGGTDTPGTAMDVCTVNDVAIVADGTNGVSVFNIFNQMPPLLIGRVEPSGTGVVSRVACSGSLVAAARDLAGLTIFDISTPPDLRLLHQVSVGGAARAVTAESGIAYVGTARGDIVAVDMASGTVLQKARVVGPVQDLAFGKDMLYACLLYTSRCV